MKATDLEKREEEMMNEKRPHPQSERSLFIQRATQKPAHAPLALWTPAFLENSSVDCHRGAYLLLQRGATQALILERQGRLQDVSLYRAAIAIQPTLQTKDKLTLWNGLQWNPEIVPEMWTHIIRDGIIELAPPSASTNPQSYRNLARAAFGIRAEEWLLLIQTPARVFAFVSPQSLIPELSDLLSYFQKKI